jgi:Fur family zinc uptake transcriptional regulator
MINVDSIIDEAEERCREQGGRLTEKRKQVLSGLLHSDTALSAYELVDYCKDEYGYSIPAMSVYRILDFLQEQHLVHKLNLANKYVACAHITCDHDHGVPQFLICGNCQRVKEISVSKATINALKRSVDEAGYQLVSPQLEMNCLCQTCRADSA